MHSHSHTHAGHDHSHQHHHRHASNKRNLWWVLILSASYMIAEILGGIASGSLALLADAGHMAIDTAAVALSLFAIWVAQKPPTPEKTFGYYRAEILAALVNGALLVAVAFGILIEAFHRLSSPVEVHGQLMVLVGAGGFVVNLIGLRLTHGGSEHSLNVRGVWLHLIADLLGSVAAATAGLLIWKFGWLRADPIISFALGALILVGSFRLLSECVNVLLEGAPRGTDLRAIKAHIEGMKGVRDIHDLHVWTVSSGVVALSAHVRLHENVDSAVVLEAITEMLHHQYEISHATLQLEPPSFEHGHTTLECQKV